MLDLNRDDGSFERILEFKINRSLDPGVAHTPLPLFDHLFEARTADHELVLLGPDANDRDRRRFGCCTTVHLKVTLRNNDDTQWLGIQG